MRPPETVDDYQWQAKIRQYAQVIADVTAAFREVGYNREEALELTELWMEHVHERREV